jgi:putative FmdB family regulatory protein
MPLYEYTCKQCENCFEALVFDGEAISCPHCQSAKVKRLLSVPARPRQESRELPVRCQPDLPPCGPGCCRLP